MPRQTLLNLIFALLLSPLFIPMSPGESGNAQTVVVPGEESRIWIAGRSNLNRFECYAESFEGEARQKNRSEPGGNLWDSQSIELTLSIPVQKLDCGQRRMNRDLNEALKSDQFESITFHYQNAALTEGGEENNGHYKLLVEGVLTVAGTSREIRFATDGFLMEDGKLRVRGEKTILMSDYNVTPPTGLFGLVRAQDELTVHFDIYAHEKPAISKRGGSE